MNRPVGTGPKREERLPAGRVPRPGVRVRCGLTNLARLGAGAEGFEPLDAFKDLPVQTGQLFSRGCGCSTGVGDRRSWQRSSLHHDDDAVQTR